MPKSISAVIITKNEEKYIRKCLDSVKWVDEIIIVDDYSTDKTLDIANEYTDKIYKRRLDDFASQKNFATEKTEGEWILNLDGDEAVSKELADEIKMFLAGGINKYNAFYIPIKHYIFGKKIMYGGWWPAYRKRFFRKGQARWEKPVHEELRVEGKTGHLKACLDHYCYETIAEFVDKINIYTTKDADEGGVKFNIFKLILAPPKVFLYRYILRRGFKDGIDGLIIALLMAFYAFSLRAKCWAKEKNKPNLF